MTEHLEHRSNARVQNHEEARIDAMEALWSEYEPSTKENLNLVVYGERRGGEDDLSQAKWNTLQDGLSKEKLGDAELADSARAAADYAKEAEREMLDSHLTEGYQGRDDLLMEKVYTLESNLLYHTLQTVSDRSNWYPLPENHDHFENHRELANMARSDRWEEIPGRIREIHLNNQAQAVG